MADPVAEVLAVHGERHVSIVGAEIWCATCDRPIGSAEGDDAETDLVIAAHQADVLRAKGLVASEVEWGVRYERDGDPTMDNPSGIRTVTQTVQSEAIMRAAIKNRVPISARNRRPVTRGVTPWTAADEGSERG